MGLCEQLKAFEANVDALKADIDLANDSTNDSDVARQTEDVAKVASICERSQQLPGEFQAIILAIAQDQTDSLQNPGTAQQVRTYQTEAHRRLRLMSIEAMKLKAARQAATIQRGRSQLKGHVDQLQQFVQAMKTAICQT